MSDSTRHAEIAGAGFAGLTAAVALAQRGWTVRVHEKSPEPRALGAGIILWENGLRILSAIGAYSSVMTGSFTPPFYETRLNGQSVTREAFVGDLWRTMTRQHLHDAMLREVQNLGVDLICNSEVIGAEPTGVLRLSSGRELQADLVVGADGVGSAVRNYLGFDNRRFKSRDGITRLLVPRLKPELGDGEWDNVIDFWNLEPRVLRILYVPCNENELYLAFMAPREDPEGSQVPINETVWSSNFPQLEPVIRAATKSPGRYDRYETTVLSEWTRGRVALVGDSAHAMTPSLAQGAGCAMSNALGLAVALEEQQDVETALSVWVQREKPLTDSCQAQSAELTESRNLAHGNYTNLLGIARHKPTGTLLEDPNFENVRVRG